MGKYKTELALDRQDWQAMLKDAEELRNCDENENPSKWMFFIIHSAAMKLLFPDRQAELGLTDQDWKEMRQELDRYRRDSAASYEFLQCALGMYILSAQKAVINKQGDIEVSATLSNADLHKQIPPIPKVRNF